MKRRFIYLSLLLALLAGRGYAQPENTPREKIEAFKIAFFTRQLDLTATEAQTFWPVYDRYGEEQERLRQEAEAKRRQMRQAFSGDNAAIIEQLSDEYIALKQEEATLAAKYHTEFKRVLPIRKVVLLYKAEQEFRRELLEELQRRRQERLNNRRY